MGNPVNNAVEIAIHETQLTWLVYIIGAAIGGRMTFTANDEHDILDGDLVVRVSAKWLNFDFKVSNNFFFENKNVKTGTSINEFNRFAFTTNRLWKTRIVDDVVLGSYPKNLHNRTNAKDEDLQTSLRTVGHQRWTDAVECN